MKRFLGKKDPGDSSGKKEVRKKGSRKKKKEPMPDEITVNRLFEQLVNEMATSAAERENLLKLPMVGKWDLIRAKAKKSEASTSGQKGSPSYYATQLKKQCNLLLLQELRLELSTQPLTWIQNFKDQHGLGNLFRMLETYATKSSADDDDWKQVDEIVRCAKAIMNQSVGVEVVLGTKRAVRRLGLAFRSPHFTTRQAVLEVLIIICMISAYGHRLALNAVQNYAYLSSTPSRFHFLVEYLKNPISTSDFKVTTMTLINAIVLSPKELTVRNALRVEFTNAHFEEVLASIKQSPAYMTSDLGTLVDEYEEEARVDANSFLTLFDDLKVNPNDPLELANYVRNKVKGSAALSTFNATLQHFVGFPSPESQEGLKIWLLAERVVQQLSAQQASITLDDQNVRLADLFSGMEGSVEVSNLRHQINQLTEEKDTLQKKVNALEKGSTKEEALKQALLATKPQRKLDGNKSLTPGSKNLSPSTMPANENNALVGELRRQIAELKQHLTVLAAENEQQSEQLQQAAGPEQWKVTQMQIKEARAEADSYRHKLEEQEKHIAELQAEIQRLDKATEINDLNDQVKKMKGVITAVACCMDLQLGTVTKMTQGTVPKGQEKMTLKMLEGQVKEVVEIIKPVISKQAPVVPKSSPDAAAAAEEGGGSGAPAPPGMPPPGPPAMGGGKATMPNRLMPPAPTKKLKPFYWSKIPNHQVTKTLWKEVPALKRPAPAWLTDIEEQLAAADSGLQSTYAGDQRAPAPPPLPKKYTILDPKKAENIGIMLKSRFKGLTHDAIVTAILSLDQSIFSRQSASILLALIPSASEMEMLASFAAEIEAKKDGVSLGEAEEFMLRLVNGVPQLHARVNSLVFKFDFEAKIPDLLLNVESVLKGTWEVMEGKDLRLLLEIILYLGNYLNHGTFRGACHGFKLESLQKLSDTKSKDGKLSLAHVLTRLLEADHPDLLRIGEKMPNVKDAACVSLSSIQNDLKTLSEGMKTLEDNIANVLTAPNPADKYHAIMGEFVVRARKDHSLLEAKVSNAASRFLDLLAWMGEESTVPPDVFFCHLSRFFALLERCVVDVKRERQLEENKRRRQEAKGADGEAGGNNMMDRMLNNVKKGDFRTHRKLMVNSGLIVVAKENLKRASQRKLEVPARVQQQQDSSRGSLSPLSASVSGRSSNKLPPPPLSTIKTSGRMNYTPQVPAAAPAAKQEAEVEDDEEEDDEDDYTDDSGSEYDDDDDDEYSDVDYYSDSE